METLDKTPDLLDRLRDIDTFADVGDEALEWMIGKCRYVKYPKDEYVFRDGDPVDYMQIMLQGSYVIRRERDDRKRELGVWKAPSVLGVLPFSRMVTAGADGFALEDLHMLELHRDCFVEMVNTSYPLTQALVSVMTNRVRDFQTMRLMDEKLMALGKMSAGLAHELNNPASAMVRSSRELQKHLHNTPEKFKEVVTMRVQKDAVDEVNAVLFERIEHRADTEDLSLMERESRSDDLVDWLEDHDVDCAMDIADSLVDWGFTPEHLDRIAGVLPPEAVGPVVQWVETNITTESLVEEIQTASSRIAELIASIKTYSHMDQEPSLEPIDVRGGIKSTLTMLNHRVKKQGVELHKEMEKNLPNIKALEGELNQVWTNLISNALDALPERGGKLTVRTYAQRDCVCVEVEDNGRGIPEEKQSRVFEPFFTTKGIGEGTGMGLDIVRRVVERHNGTVSLESEPGRTVFTVCLPQEAA